MNQLRSWSDGCLTRSVRTQLIAGAVFAVLLLGARDARAAAPTDLVIRSTAISFRNGSNGTYNVSVSNLGNATTDATVHVFDALPAGLTFLSGVGLGWTCSAAGQAVDCSTATPLGVGDTTILTLTVGVCTTASSVFNVLTLDYPGDTNGANNAARRTTSVRAGLCTASTATPTAGLGTVVPTRTPTLTRTPVSTHTPVPAATDLLLSKTVSGALTTGADGVYMLTVSNIGGASTNSPVTVTDTLPSGLGFVSATGVDWSCGAAGQTVTCSHAAPLAAGALTSIALRVAVASAAFPSVTNIATLAYAGDTDAGNNTARRPTTVKHGQGTSGSATATAVPGTPVPVRTATPTSTATATAANAAATDLSMGKTNFGAFTVGTNGTYALTVSNVGAAATNAPIIVTDALPNGMGFVSANGSGWSCSASGATVTCVSSSSLAAGATASLTLTVSVGSAASPTVTNTATVSYAGDINAANDTARKPTTVRARAAHSRTASASQRPQHTSPQRPPHHHTAP